MNQTKNTLEMITEYIREALLVIGFLLFARGLWMIYPPAMFIVCGAALIWVGLPRPRPRSPKKRGEG